MADKSQIATTKRTAGNGQVMDRVKAFWAGLRPQQKVYLGVGLGLTLAIAAFFVKMIATPDYKTLMTGLESADAQAISAQLAAKKIPYIVGPDGTSISVPKDQLDAARLEVSSHDSTHSGRIGFEIFDKVSWGQTEFDEKVNYQRALEGELERTIQTMSNVKSASCHGERLGVPGQGAGRKSFGYAKAQTWESVQGRCVVYLAARLRGSGRAEAVGRCHCGCGLEPVAWTEQQRCRRR